MIVPLLEDDAMATALLLCNDEYEHLLLRACLEGYAVISVQTAQEAAEVLTRARLDLAMVRVEPHDRAGMQLLCLMKRRQISVPTIVVMSGQPGPLMDDVLQLNVRAVVWSPIHFRSVRRVILDAQQDAPEAYNDDMRPTAEEESMAMPV